MNKVEYLYANVTRVICFTYGIIYYLVLFILLGDYLNCSGKYDVNGGKS